jgi:hypothetical protein
MRMQRTRSARFARGSSPLMRRPLGGVKLSCALIAACAVAIMLATVARAESPAKQPGGLGVGEQRALREAIGQVRAAIVDGDVAALLQHISRVEPLVCTDTTYSYKEVEKFLADPNSHLFLSLFDSARFAHVCGADYGEASAISDKEFLAGPDLQIEIVGLEDGWAKATLKSSVKGRYPLEWFFHKDGKAWRIAGASFVVGACSCG